jgi:hypothetical protein
VKDYGIVNEEAWERVEKLRIRKRVESDYLEIVLRKPRRGKNKEGMEWGIGVELFILNFFGVAVLCLKKM